MTTNVLDDVVSKTKYIKVSKPQVELKNLLPCEECFTNSKKEFDVANMWLQTVQDRYDTKIKYIEPAILKKMKKKTVSFETRPSLIVDLPVYAMINPFKQPITDLKNWPELGSDAIDRGGLSVHADISMSGELRLRTNVQSWFNVSINYTKSWFSLNDISATSNFILGIIGCIIAGIMLYSGITTGAGGLGPLVFFGLVLLLPCLCLAWANFGIKHYNSFKDSEDVRMKFVTHVPGLIPENAKKTIIEAKEIADSVGGEVKLIVEADWKTVGATSEIKPKDPLIVIVKDDTIAYIDRFDCTTLETALAQGHTTPV